MRTPVALLSSVKAAFNPTAGIRQSPFNKTARVAGGCCKPASGRSHLRLRRACLLVEPLIDPGDFRHPLLTLQVLHSEYLVVRPVEVISNVSYLFIEPRYGVAPDPPGLATSNSKGCSQCGHWARTRAWPV